MTTERTPQHCGFLSELQQLLFYAYGSVSPRIRQLILDTDAVIGGQRREGEQLRCELGATSVTARDRAERMDELREKLGKAETELIRCRFERDETNRRLENACKESFERAGKLHKAEERIANLDSQLLDATKANCELTRQLDNARMDVANACYAVRKGQEELACVRSVLRDRDKRIENLESQLERERARNRVHDSLGPRVEFDRITLTPTSLTFHEKGGVSSLQPVSEDELRRLGSALWEALVNKRTTHVMLYGSFRPDHRTKDLDLRPLQTQTPNFNGPSPSGSTRDEVDGGDGA